VATVIGVRNLLSIFSGRLACLQGTFPCLNPRIHARIGFRYAAQCPNKTVCISALVIDYARKTEMMRKKMVVAYLENFLVFAWIGWAKLRLTLVSIDDTTIDILIGHISNKMQEFSYTKTWSLISTICLCFFQVILSCFNFWKIVLVSALWNFLSYRNFYERINIIY
jgi:hypothetical protein